MLEPRQSSQTLTSTNDGDADADAVDDQSWPQRGALKGQAEQECLTVSDPSKSSGCLMQLSSFYEQVSVLC